MYCQQGILKCSSQLFLVELDEADLKEESHYCNIIHAGCYLCCMMRN